MSNFEIEKSLIASTAHVSQDDMSYLRERAYDGQLTELYFSEFDWGWKVRLPGEFQLSDIGHLKISDGLRDLIIFTISLDCVELVLDQDGPVYDNFKTYEW